MTEPKRSPPRIFIHHAESGKYLQVYDGLTLGRAGTKDRMAQDLRLSARHCRFQLNSVGLFSLEDLESSNGTWLNERALTPGKKVSVKEGDTIRIGGQNFTITLHGSDGTALIEKTVTLFTKPVRFLAKRGKLSIGVAVGFALLLIAAAILLRAPKAPPAPHAAAAASRR